MLESAVITLREGLEAFLIVAISLAYLKKTGRWALTSAVRWGVVAALAASLLAGYLFQRAANQALWEGVPAMVAAILVASLTVHMWRAGRRMRQEIHARLEASAVKPGRAAWLGVFAFTVLMIGREGMETAVLFNALVTQVRSAPLLTGAVLGLAAAILMALAWARWGHHVNLGLFLQVSAIFLLIFVVQLFIYGFHELTEANLFPGSEALHWATEPYGPDGRYGRFLTYLLVLLPGGWLGLSLLRARLAPARA
ncbi:MAG: FTR1 family protein [Thermoanaerobaculia bacterium]